ncbi:MAG: pyruvate dehydrogenase (acetyl-transferring) E1 component subunit alpha [Bacteroidota bacterium]
MFKEYNPIKDKILRIIDNEGKVINKEWKPNVDDTIVLKAYKDMLFARTADIMAVSFQRQGRMFTYPPNYGQEAVSGALAQVIKEEDWLVPAFRELGAWLAKGATMKDLFLYFKGNEEGTAFRNAKKLLPISVPIASQLLHAVGIGYSINYKNEKDVVYVFVGDGGTSEGDFHEALNLASVWKVPVIFIVQNNQFAISVPVNKQMASENIAMKSIAYGMPGIKVDGNDFFAMYAALDFSQEYARSGKGPVIIEALTYRAGAHTTSDDPTKYRTKKEEEFWAKTDPMKRLGLYLKEKNLMSDNEELNLIAQYKKDIDRQFDEAEKAPESKLEDVFKYMYAEMPDDLRLQQMEYEKFLKWKESNL